MKKCLDKIEGLLFDYLDILDAMEELQRATKSTMYGFDTKRSAIHKQICEYYELSVEETKPIFTNLRPLFGLTFPKTKYDNRRIDAIEIAKMMMRSENRRYFEDDKFKYFNGTHAKISRGGKITTFIVN